MKLNIKQAEPYIKKHNMGVPLYNFKITVCLLIQSVHLSSCLIIQDFSTVNPTCNWMLSIYFYFVLWPHSCHFNSWCCQNWSPALFINHKSRQQKPKKFQLNNRNRVCIKMWLNFPYHKHLISLLPTGQFSAFGCHFECISKLHAPAPFLTEVALQLHWRMLSYKGKGSKDF
jgi:hypothetical protein